jgi:transaldolase
MKNKFKIKIYADGADISSILNLNKNKIISGFTTNPSLMRKSGVKNYKDFCKSLLKKIKKKPISFEVFSDDLTEMKSQALEIASWGKNVFVKIPIINSKNINTASLIKDLSAQGININVTAIFSLKQVKKLITNFNPNSKIILSVFSGRIADTGVDPEDVINKIYSNIKNKKKISILWASSREIFNLYQAEKSNCHIITLGADLISKLKYYKKNLEEYSRETVVQFNTDAKKSKFKI